MLGKAVHVQLMGGLGNQMFQYAAGRTLALRSNARLCIDAKTGFKRDTVYRRRFELGELPIVGELGSVVTQLPYYGERIWQRLRSVRSEIERRPWGTQINQMKEKYEASFREFRATGNTWINGYWQSEKYFEDFRNEIGRELSPVRPNETAYQRLAEKMMDQNSIAVGVRLFEEVPASAALLKASITPTQFYSNAASIVAKDIANPQFFVFCTKRFPVLDLLDLPGPVHFVTHDEGYCGSVNRLWLFSQCSNYILSHSSFYWWGAWLSEFHKARTRIVASLSFPSRDTVPPRWSQV